MTGQNNFKMERKFIETENFRRLILERLTTSNPHHFVSTRTQIDVGKEDKINYKEDVAQCGGTFRDDTA